MIFDIFIKTQVRVEMSNVSRLNTKNNMRDQFIQNRLEKLMPKIIMFSYIPIKNMSDDPTKLLPTGKYLEIWDWLDFWIFLIIN